MNAMDLLLLSRNFVMLGIHVKIYNTDLVLMVMVLPFFQYHSLS